MAVVSPVLQSWRSPPFMETVAECPLHTSVSPEMVVFISESTVMLTVSENGVLKPSAEMQRTL